VVGPALAQGGWCGPRIMLKIGVAHVTLCIDPWQRLTERLGLGEGFLEDEGKEAVKCSGRHACPFDE
jgi:hypothetical protein